jgi:hypothetical protein
MPGAVALEQAVPMQEERLRSYPEQIIRLLLLELPQVALPRGLPAILHGLTLLVQFMPRVVLEELLQTEERQPEELALLQAASAMFYMQGEMGRMVRPRLAVVVAEEQAPAAQEAMHQE